MSNAKKGKREKIENVLKSLKYKMYQAHIQNASHDDEFLVKTAVSIIRTARKLLKEGKKNLLGS